MSLNAKKSKYIIHKLGNKQVNNILLKVPEIVIERIQHFNLLVVTLDVHITHISIKCSKLIGDITIHKLWLNGMGF